MFRRRKEKILRDYRMDIPEYSDERIVEILKQRNYYEADAAKMAIEEAIKRGIIYSEQDLFAKEYEVETLEYSLFPNIKRSKNRNNIRKSIARSLVISGVIPLVYGLVQLNANNLFEAGALFIAGAFWIFLSAQLVKAFIKSSLVGLWSLTLLGLVYIFMKLVPLKGLSFFDYFIPGALFLLILYGLHFIWQINKK